jgi:hypothetical protein
MTYKTRTNYNMAPQYPRSKIYKIVNSVNDIIYIGSTTLKYLSERMGNHRQKQKDVVNKNSPFYIAMRAIGVEHFKIVLEHYFPCTSKDQLEKEEYRVLDAYIAAGTSVYNSTINGKPSVEHILKTVAANTGDKSCKFKHGSVSFYSKGSSPSWMFNYTLDGKRICTSYAIKKHGFWNAKAMIEAQRQIIYPKWVKDPEEAILDELNAIDMD